SAAPPSQPTHEPPRDWSAGRSAVTNPPAAARHSPRTLDTGSLFANATTGLAETASVSLTSPDASRAWSFGLRPPRFSCFDGESGDDPRVHRRAAPTTPPCSAGSSATATERQAAPTSPPPNSPPATPRLGRRS